MADLRKRVQNKGCTDLDTETENEGANQDSDAVCRITLFNFFYQVFFIDILLNVFQNLDLDSEDDKSLGKKVDLSSTIPSGTDKAPEMLDATLSALPPRQENVVCNISEFCN